MMKRQKVLIFFVACISVAQACHNSISASQATSFFGFTSNSNFGHLISKVGDVNNDGFDDFLVGAWGEASSSGVVYLVFGRSSSDWMNTNPNTFHFDLYPTTPNSSSWIKISTTISIAYMPQDGIASGDFNADGITDFCLSTCNNPQPNARAYCVYGHSGAWRSFSTSEVNREIPGFTIYGVQYTSAYFIHNAGDLNSDGIDDIVWLYYMNSPTTYSGFVIFGQKANDMPEVYLSSSYSGFAISGFYSITTLGFNAGDINGDTYNDLIITDYTSRKAFVLFSKNVSWSSVNLISYCDGVNGFIISNSQIVYSSSAGDINNDGFDDIYVGSETGAWVIFGHSAPWISPFDVLMLNGTNGFHFISANGENIGETGRGISDVNADGIDDLIINGYKANSTNGTLTTGASVIIFGHSTDFNWPEVITRNEVKGSVGYQIDGISTGSSFGYSSQGIGDCNGDGIDDFVVGAPHYHGSTGFATLFFGENDHCAVCSNFSDICLVCRDGLTPNSTGICSNPAIETLSSSPKKCNAQQGTISGNGIAVVIQVEFGTTCELLDEIQILIGTQQVQVIQISSLVFEVIVENMEIALQLIDSMHKCMA